MCIRDSRWHVLVQKWEGVKLNRLQTDPGVGVLAAANAKVSFLARIHGISGFEPWHPLAKSTTTGVWGIA